MHNYMPKVFIYIMQAPVFFVQFPVTSFIYTYFIFGFFLPISNLINYRVRNSCCILVMPCTRRGNNAAVRQGAKFPNIKELFQAL